MTTALFALAMSMPALGAPALSHSWDKPRTIHIDMWSFGQAYDPWGSDWNSTDMEQWTAVLSCTPAGKRIESCTFHDNTLLWGYVIQGSGEVKYVPIEMPATLELGWSEQGRLQRWDVKGDRQAFWTQASNAYVGALFRVPGMVFKPDSQREIGQRIEQSLCRKLASALELELPKKGDTTSGKWTTNKPLWAGRRYSQGPATAKVAWEIPEVEGEVATVTWSGQQSESEIISNIQVQTQLMGQASFSSADSRATHIYTESAVTAATGVLSDHTRFMTYARPFEGAKVVPQQMPEPKLGM